VPTSTSPSRGDLRVLIAGGGVAGLEAMLALRRLAEERIDIELLAAETHFWYRPLAVGEPFGLGEVHGLDLGVVADDFGAGLTLGELQAVDAEAHVARTAAGAELEYDVLVIAVGARPVAAVPGAVTFRGPADTDAIKALLEELASGAAQRVAFALPGGAGWPLPLYELALQTGVYVREHGLSTELTIVTPEERALDLLGPAAQAVVARLLDERSIALREASYPVSFDGKVLSLKPADTVAADRVVALPRLEGPEIEGIPCDTQGFIPIDRHARVHGLSDVFAAGDATSFPVKQGGLGAQQADAAAQVIAARAGADIEQEPFRPVLRGLVLTGGAPLYARADLMRPGFAAGTSALWWPPGKIVGRYLAPYLAERSGAILTPPAAGAVTVAIELASPAASAP
jgi:sulfide:quinone oxidoreductase